MAKGGKAGMKTHHKALHRERQTKAYEKRDKLQDRWAQIVFHYVKHEDPMSTEYYKKQRKWFKEKGGDRAQEYRKLLKEYYEEHKHELDADGKAPKRPNRRKLDRDRRKREKEGGEEEPPRKKSNRKIPSSQSAPRREVASKRIVPDRSVNEFDNVRTDDLVDIFDGMLDDNEEEKKQEEEPVNVDEEAYDKAMRTNVIPKKTGDHYKDTLAKMKAHGHFADFITDDKRIPDEDMQDILENPDDYDLNEEDINVLLQYQELHPPPPPEDLNRKRKRNDEKRLLDDAYGGNMRLRASLLKAMNEADLAREQLDKLMDFF